MCGGIIVNILQPLNSSLQVQVHPIMIIAVPVDVVSLTVGLFSSEKNPDEFLSSDLYHQLTFLDLFDVWEFLPLSLKQESSI